MMERVGGWLKSYQSVDGADWVLISSRTIAMGNSIYAGLALSSLSSANGAASAEFSDVSAASISSALAPTAPGTPAVSAISSAAFTLSWAASSDNVAVTGYRLDVSRAAGFTSFVTGYNNKDVGNVLSAAVTGLTDGATYYAGVRAYDADANISSNSAVSSAFTLDVSSPIAPGGLAASDIKPADFILGWTAATDNAAVARDRAPGWLY